MQSSSLGVQVWQVWVRAAYLRMTGLDGRSNMKLPCGQGVVQKFIWHLAHCIRETWSNFKGLFGGPAGIDETNISGRERNDRKNECLNARLGAAGKTTVVATKDRETNQVVAWAMEDVTQVSVKGLIGDIAESEAMEHTDDSAVHKNLLNCWTINRNLGEYVRNRNHSNGFKTFWRMLKRGYEGTCSKMSVKHLQRYVNKFVGKHYVRAASTIERIGLIEWLMVGKHLRFRVLVA